MMFYMFYKKMVSHGASPNTPKSPLYTYNMALQGIFKRLKNLTAWAVVQQIRL